MLQDYVRTATYQQAIMDNAADFRGSLVMDVGAGTGILSLFAAQARPDERLRQIRISGHGSAGGWVSP